MTGILPIKKDGSQSAISDFQEFSVIFPMEYAQFVGLTEGGAAIRRRICGYRVPAEENVAHAGIGD